MEQQLHEIIENALQHQRHVSLSTKRQLGPEKVRLFLGEVSMKCAFGEFQNQNFFFVPEKYSEYSVIPNRKGMLGWIGHVSTLDELSGYLAQFTGLPSAANQEFLMYARPIPESQNPDAFELVVIGKKSLLEMYGTPQGQGRYEIELNNDMGRAFRTSLVRTYTPTINLSLSDEQRIVLATPLDTRRN